LKFFHACAEHRSFSRAAEKLSISQPALSQGIKALEKELKHKLFVRDRGICLTPQGERLFTHCERLFTLIENIKDDLASAGKGIKGVIKAGILESILLYVFPRIISEYSSGFPKVTFKFEKAETIPIEKAVLEERLHFGIISRPSSSKKLEDRKLAEYPHSLFVATDQKGPLEVLAKSLPLYLLGSWQAEALKHKTDLFVRFHNIKCLNPINCVAVVRQLVANGLGMAVLPSFVLGQDLRIVESYPDFRMGLYLIRKGRRRINALADHFTDFLLARNLKDHQS